MSNVLVTGASSGIGLATVVRLARSGHRVFAGVRDVEGANDLRAALEKEQLSDKAKVEQLDVTSDESVKAAVARVQAEGDLDILINNAGISVGSALEPSSLDDAHRIFETNYFGVMRMVQAVLPSMRARKAGTIVNVGSISGLVGIPCLGHYSSSKVALEFMSEILACEVYRFGIRVILFEPGITKTPMYTRRSNLRPIDPRSPYLDDLASLYAFFEKGLKGGNALTAEDCAETIENAINDPDKKFRYLLGKDAEGIVKARRSVTDEEWISSPAARTNWMKPAKGT